MKVDGLPNNWKIGESQDLLTFNHRRTDEIQNPKIVYKIYYTLVLISFSLMSFEHDMKIK